MDYQFRCAQPQDADTVIAIIRERVDWMESHNMGQWDEEYLKAFPADYFRKRVKDGEIYLVCTSNNEIVGLTAVMEQDPYWGIPSDKNCYYLHHLATRCGIHGAGKALLLFCEQLARKNGKECLRLDCQTKNHKLNEFYEQLGYKAVGTMSDGGYEGIKREKPLR